jgi:hypothetical protein
VSAAACTPHALQPMKVRVTFRQTNFQESVMRRLLLAFVMLLSVAGVVVAEDREQHGDWSSQFLDDMGEASTHEGGTSVFGMLCANDSCRYYFANGIDCQSGLHYPLMLTTSAGTLAIDAICEPMNTANGDVMLYWFSESPKLNDAFVTSADIGIAYPLAGEQFKLSKFSMKGYEAAIERMVNGVRERRGSDQQQANGRT